MKTFLLCLSLVATAPALAAAPQEGDKRKGSDMICKMIKETGSRLSSTRVCMTRDEWAEQKRMQRADLDRAQSRRLEPQAN